MPTYSPFTEQADCLRTDIRDVMSQIHSAESGNRLERNQFLALITRKNSILTESNRIISEVNHTLNFASSDRSNHIPFAQYQDLKNARTIAREVIKLARSNAPQTPPTPPSPPNPAPNLDSWDYEFVDDDDLPF
jgi:hypothetical protein